jgi:hypothetical protein
VNRAAVTTFLDKVELAFQEFENILFPHKTTSIQKTLKTYASDVPLGNGCA